MHSTDLLVLLMLLCFSCASVSSSVGQKELLRNTDSDRIFYWRFYIKVLLGRRGLGVFSWWEIVVLYGCQESITNETSLEFLEIRNAVLIPQGELAGWLILYLKINVLQNWKICYFGRKYMIKAIISPIKQRFKSDNTQCWWTCVEPSAFICF